MYFIIKKFKFFCITLIRLFDGRRLEEKNLSSGLFYCFKLKS